MTPEDRQHRLEELRATIVEANPNTWDVFSERRCPCGVLIQEHVDRHIGLADVLLAYRETADKDNSISQESWQTGILHTVLHWQLGKDSLDKQSDKCLEFLHSLLCGR